MHQALTSEPTGQSPRKVALRSLAVAFLAILLVFLQARLSRDLQIVFDLRVERPGPYQLYLADDQGNFSERLNYTRSTRAGEWRLTKLKLSLATDPVGDVGGVANLVSCCPALGNSKLASMAGSDIDKFSGTSPMASVSWPSTLTQTAAGL